MIRPMIFKRSEDNEWEPGVEISDHCILDKNGQVVSDIWDDVKVNDIQIPFALLIDCAKKHLVYWNAPPVKTNKR
jgi:hypothetical protein